MREYFDPRLELLGYLFTMSEPTINSVTSLQILRQTYTQQVLKTVIPRNTDLPDAHFNKMDIFSANPRAKAVLAYDKLRVPLRQRRDQPAHARAQPPPTVLARGASRR